MFDINDNIMYGNVGVCRIDGILSGDKIGMNPTRSITSYIPMERKK